MKKGTKEKEGLFAYRPHELEQAICCCLGSRDIVALKVMLFLTGNSNDGDFRIVQKTIYDRMKISEKTYYNARKALQEMGWIQYVEVENVIYVNYDKIYADYRNYQEKKKAGSLYESPNSFSTKDSADATNDSSKTFSTKDSAVVKVLAEQFSNQQENCCDDNQQNCHEERYNNIKNNKRNNKKEKISSGAGCPGGQPPQDLIDKAFEYRNRRDCWDEYMRSLERWVYNSLKEQNLPIGSEEYRAKYGELEAMANRCLHVLYGYTNSYYEEYQEPRW